MSKYFEVIITSQRTYTVEAETEEDAVDIAWNEHSPEFNVEAEAFELKGKEQIERSKRHSDFVLE